MMCVGRTDNSRFWFSIPVSRVDDDGLNERDLERRRKKTDRAVEIVLAGCYDTK